MMDKVEVCREGDGDGFDVVWGQVRYTRPLDYNQISTGRGLPASDQTQ